MSRQTTLGLASIFQGYSRATGDLLAELSEATAQDEKSGDVTLRLVQEFSRFVNRAAGGESGVEMRAFSETWARNATRKDTRQRKTEEAV